MIEKYVRWLLESYIKSDDGGPGGVLDHETVAAAVATLGRHIRRWPGEEDFVSLVALDVADRIARFNEPGRERLPFLLLLDQAAGAVRGRLGREAMKRLRHAGGESADRLPAPEPSDADAVRQVRELIDRLPVKEQAILWRLLAGQPVDGMAKEAGVSKATMYRRLQEIPERLGNGRRVTS